MLQLESCGDCHVWQWSVVQAYGFVANGAVEMHVLVFIDAVVMVMAVAQLVFHACASVIDGVHKVARAEEAKRAGNARFVEREYAVFYVFHGKWVK